MPCAPPSRLVSPFSLVAIANFLALSVGSVLYCVFWLKHTQNCGTGGALITSLCALNALDYCCAFLSTMVAVWAKSRSTSRSNHKLAYVVMMTSAIAAGMTILTGIGMIVSMFFRFDPSCLENGYNMLNYTFLFLLTGWGIVSSGVLFFTFVYLVSKIEDSEDMDRIQEERRRSRPPIYNIESKPVVQLI